MWFPFWKKKKTAPLVLPGQWVLVPLGNPGIEYADTRHNLGRLMVQRWMDRHCQSAEAIHSFCYGKAYSLVAPLIATMAMVALVPSTYMNLSGKSVAEAVRLGFPLQQMLVVYDDKDLPLGTGRLSKDGGSAGHKGLNSIIDELGTDAILRLRLGIGPFQRPLHDWVLEAWTQEEWGAIEKMDAPFATAMSILSEGLPVVELQNRINAPGFWR